MLRINDRQKHKVLYTWELYDVIINFQCVIFADHLLKVVSAGKFLQYVIANLNLKGLSFFCTLCIPFPINALVTGPGQIRGYH